MSLLALMCTSPSLRTWHSIQLFIDNLPFYIRHASFPTLHSMFKTIQFHSTSQAEQ